MNLLMQIWPFLFVMTICFIGSYFAKRSYNNKFANAIKAKVVNVEETGRIESNYTTHIRYNITVAYKQNGQIKYGTVNRYPVQWPVNSIVDINVYKNFVTILTPIPKNSYIKQFPPLYKCLMYAGCFFLGFTILSTCAQFEHSAMLIAPMLLCLISFFVAKYRKKYLKQAEDIHNNIVDINGKVQKILSNRQSNGGYTYYAVIEYELDNVEHTYDKIIRPQDYNIGDIVSLQCNKKTGMVNTLTDKKINRVNFICLGVMIATSMTAIIIAATTILTWIV